MNIAETWPAKTGDSCADFFGTCLRAVHPDIPADANVLEIGCAEYDWLSQASNVWPEMMFTGIDVRARKPSKAKGALHPERITAIAGDVLTHDFPAESFDWIVSISAIEHVGLGHYGDPKDPDGDTKAVARAWRWLKPGGWLFFDVPWNAGEDAYQVVGTSHRVYDDATVRDRLMRGVSGLLMETGIAHKTRVTELLTNPPRLKGGEDFYYLGLWLRKPL